MNRTPPPTFTNWLPSQTMAAREPTRLDRFTTHGITVVRSEAINPGTLLILSMEPLRFNQHGDLLDRVEPGETVGGWRNGLPEVWIVRDQGDLDEATMRVRAVRLTGLME